MMDQSFDEWMAQQFPNEEPEEAPELAGALADLCDHHNLPPEALEYLLKETIELWGSVAHIRSFAEHCEAEGYAQPGFWEALQATVLRYLQRDAR
jgi:hypothetical protein